MPWLTIILQEIDYTKTLKGALNGLIKIKKEESKYGGGGLVHFAQIILIQNNKVIRFGGQWDAEGFFHLILSVKDVPPLVSSADL